MKVVTYSHARNTLKSLLDAVVQDIDVTVISRRDAEDDAVIADEKIRFRNHRSHVVIGVIGKHQPADHRLLCLQ